MDAYLLLLLLSCLTACVCATSILTRDSLQTANRCSAGIVYGGAFWAFCELLWSHTDNPLVALHLVKLSALGWIAIGPLGLLLMLELSGARTPAMHKLVRVLSVSSVLLLLVDWATPWLHRGVVRTSYGWSFEFGPAYPLYYLMTISGVILGLSVAYRAYREWPSASERNQARSIAMSIMVPLVLASLTDGVLPFMGIHVWHLGSPSIAVLGLAVAWIFYRYGYSLLSPGTFAPEILDTMPDGLALLRLDGRIRRMNHRLVKLAGCSHQDELISASIEELLEGRQLSLEGDWRELECRFVPRKGEAFPVSVSCSMLYNRLEEPTGFVMVIRDLREVVNLRQRLIISGRMAAVGQLAAGVAHEINNPMAYVRANLSLLEEHWAKLAKDGESDQEGLRSEGEELIHESMEGVDRVTTIARDIRRFSHAGTGQREEADLNQVLESALRIAAPQTRGKARFEQCFAALPMVRCAPREIEQVFLNLILNSVDSRVDETQPIDLRIETRCSPDAVSVIFEDNGSGIEPQILDRIFDPFFTTKPVGKGTGLGLALSYEIVRRHDGDISVRSRPGQGSRFVVSLPSAREQEGPHEGPAPQPTSGK